MTTEQIAVSISPALLNSSQFFVVVLGLDGKIIYKNPLFEMHFPRVETENQKEIFPYFTDPKYLEPFQKLFDDCLQHPHGTFTMLLTREDSNKDVFLNKWEFAGIPDASGKISSVLGIGFDLDKTKDIKEENDLLVRQSEFLRQLTFNQSHVMRSRLANIIGLLNIMDSKFVDAETTSFLKMIKEEANKLDEAIKESIYHSSILDFNSLEK